MEKEIWKSIPDFEGYYEVSDMGRIRSVDRVVPHRNGYMNLKGKMLSLCKDGGGYVNVSLLKNCKTHRYRLHQLVAITFLNHKPKGRKGLIVDHIDNDKSNNNLNNIQITTYRMNNSKDRKNKTSKYTGVSWNKRDKKWRVSVNFDGKNKNLGNYSNEEEAKDVYQNYIKTLNTKVNEEQRSLCG